MNPNLLTIYQSPFPKRRVGRWTDGGYAIAEIPEIKYNALFVGGTCDDISFEEDFIRRQLLSTKCMPEVYAFDGSVSELPKSEFENQIKFTQKNIGEHETADTTNLHNIFLQFINNPESNIFVKMDIEGGEVDWIRSLRPEHMNSIAQFVMEFHHPFSVKEVEMFDKINKTHLPIHFHPNNVGGTRVHNGVYMPNIFEITYLHKRFFYDGKAELNRDFIPNDNVDVRNLSDKEEIWIGHPPFVHFDKFERKL